MLLAQSDKCRGCGGSAPARVVCNLQVRSNRMSPNSAPAPPSNRVEWRQTNPIPGWGGATGGTECAKQTQFAPADRNRWGKPHPTSGRNGAKRTQFRRPGRGLGDVGRGAIVRNKPNSRRAGSVGPVRRAKQSQFPPARRLGPAECAKQSQFAGRDRPKALVARAATKQTQFPPAILPGCRRCVSSCSSARLLLNAACRPPAGY